MCSRGTEKALYTWYIVKSQYGAITAALYHLIISQGILQYFPFSTHHSVSASVMAFRYYYSGSFTVLHQSRYVKNFSVVQLKQIPTNTAIASLPLKYGRWISIMAGSGRILNVEGLSVGVVSVSSPLTSRSVNPR